MTPEEKTPELIYGISSREHLCQNCNTIIPKGYLVFINKKTRKVVYHFTPEIYKLMLKEAKKSGLSFKQWFEEELTGCMVKYIVRVFEDAVKEAGFKR